MTVDQAMQTALAQHQSGQWASAETLYRQVLAVQPDHVEALHLLGILLAQAGRPELSVDLLRRVMALQPDHFKAASNLAHFLTEIGRFDEGVALCQHAITINPNCAPAYNNLGNALLKLNRAPEALAAFEQALRIDPSHALAHNNRGMVLASTGEHDQALAAYRRAIELEPGMAMAYSNLGKELASLHRLDEAVAAYRVAVRLKPDHPMFHWNLALALLAMGQFAEGWGEFEWRTKLPGLRLGREYPQPLWMGHDLRGKKLFLYGESGYGDAIQFIRYVPLLKDRGAYIILECQPPLATLFAGMPGVHSFVTQGSTLPSFDFHISIQSLPRIFRTDLYNIPTVVPYLKPPPEYVARWRPRLSGEGFKVGLVWKGASHDRLTKEGGLRGADMLEPLSQVSGVQFFSLQKDAVPGLTVPKDINLTDLAADLHDFADTAAVIDHLNLVISVDTSVAHLAGALAKPVWTILPFAADFRWLIDRQDTPWYPTMRLFRQANPKDFAGPIAHVAAALKDMAR